MKATTQKFKHWFLHSKSAFNLLMWAPVVIFLIWWFGGTDAIQPPKPENKFVSAYEAIQRPLNPGTKLYGGGTEGKYFGEVIEVSAGNNGPKYLVKLGVGDSIWLSHENVALSCELKK